MERLTEIQSAGYDLKELNGEWCNKYCEKQKAYTCDKCGIYQAIQKLAEYEDAEEQGRLISLPCKVGDTVYHVVQGRIVEVSNVDLFFLLLSVVENRFNNSVFLTKSEAEQKLKEMERIDMDDTNCPKCNYDIYEIYNRVCEGGKSKYCKITNIHSGSCGDFYGTDWDVECICPKCKTKFTFSDSDY